jgi:hypothetical protein
MALANFLGKSALSASQVLKKFNFDNFQKLLLSRYVRICFNKASIKSSEGFATADMLVRLLARLYPNLSVHCVDGVTPELQQLHDLALSINPNINLTDSEEAITALIGDTDIEKASIKIYIGSDKWISKFSRTEPQSCGNSSNKFGPGAAACFAAANIFRCIFSDQLSDGELDNDFIYSLFNGKINEEAMQGPEIDRVIMDDTVLVGLGAIGNAVIWSLTSLEINGNLHLVDGELIDRSNLQRYILTNQNDIDQPKTSVAIKFLHRSDVHAHSVHFDQYLQKRGNWNILRAAVCVDSAHHRRMVQGSLPKKLINAWTQQEQCGLSRHYDFIDEPCLCCLYPANKEAKSLPMKIAESLGLSRPLQLQLIRDYMAREKPVDVQIVNMIAQAKNIEANQLMTYIGKRLEVFYAEVVCGGVMMTLAGGEQKEAAEVPSAFESAMSGLMLGAELIIDSAQLRKDKPYIIQKLNLLRPISPYTYDSVKKPGTSLCICQDEIYKARYTDKWKVNLRESFLETENVKPLIKRKIHEVESADLKS